MTGLVALLVRFLLAVIAGDAPDEGDEELTGVILVVVVGELDGVPWIGWVLRLFCVGVVVRIIRGAVSASRELPRGGEDMYWELLVWLLFRTELLV